MKVVVAGPNGAGKSTVAPRVVRDLHGVADYVNADTLALGLSAFAPERAAIAAGRMLLQRVRELAASDRDVAFETTLASRSFAPWLAELRARGAQVHVVFLALPDAELSVARVSGRVQLGGHDVPPDTIRRRFARGLVNLRELYAPLATTWRVVDASRLPPAVVGADDDLSRAVADGVRDALRRHALHDVPAATWRDGRVVLAPASELLRALA